MEISKMFDLALVLAVPISNIGCTGSETEPVANDTGQNSVVAIFEAQAAAAEFYQAYYDQAWDVYYSFFAEDVVLINNAGDALTLAKYKERAAEQASLIGSVITESMKDRSIIMRVSPTGQSAIAYWKHPFDYRTDDGKETTIHWAETDVWWKYGDVWKVAHIHYHEIEGS